MTRLMLKAAEPTSWMQSSAFENKNRPLATEEQLLQAIADADGKPINEGTEPMNQFAGYYQDGKKCLP
jgi:hypothetical protein